MEESAAASTPGWALALVGALAASWLEDGRGEPAAAPRAATAFALERANARELRAVPGLGETRALALIEARWERGPDDPPLLLGDVAGVGPAIEAAVRAWL